MGKNKPKSLHLTSVTNSTNKINLKAVGNKPNTVIKNLISRQKFVPDPTPEPTSLPIPISTSTFSRQLSPQTIQLKKSRQNSQQAKLPLVSIITSIHNVQDYIITTIHSIIDQVYKNWELLIIDDASTDNTCLLLRDCIRHLPAHLRNKIQLHTNIENKGKFYNLNIGIQKSTGEYITFIDGDDIYHPSKLKYQVDMLLKKQKIAAVFTSYLRVRSINLPKNLLDKPTNIVYSRPFYENGIMFRRKIIKEVGYYDSVRFNGDDEFANRLRTYYKHDKIEVIQSYLYYAVQRPGSLTTSKSTGYKSEARTEYRHAYKRWHDEYKKLEARLRSSRTSASISQTIDNDNTHNKVNLSNVKGLHRNKNRRTAINKTKKRTKPMPVTSEAKTETREELQTKLKKFLYMPFPLTLENYPIKLSEKCQEFITFKSSHSTLN